MNRKVLNESPVGRRQFLRDASITASFAFFSPGFLFAGESQSTAAMADAMDEALERLAGLALLTNHGPMAAEALVAMGCADRVVPFVERYKRRFSSPFPARVAPIDPNVGAML